MAHPTAAPPLRRVYEPPAAGDGTRILVERLWPRGIRKEDPRVTTWLKEIAPSPALRAWYSHDVAKWTEFQRRYRAELDANGEAVARLRALLAAGPATLVFASKDAERCSARVLVDWLGEH